MSNTLHLLILEDNIHDAELAVSMLQEAGYTCQWERVETQPEFQARIKTNDYDVILADYNLPTFDGLTALEIVRESGRDVPFILISGTVGEEIAIESLKAGATDYVLKRQLSRLGPVVARALSERDEQRQRQRAEKALEELNVLLEERVQQRTFEMEVLYELSQQVGYIFDYEELFRLILTHLHRAVPYDIAGAVLTTDGGPQLFVNSVSTVHPVALDELKKDLLTIFTQRNGSATNHPPVDIDLLGAGPHEPMQAPITELGSTIEIPLTVGQDGQAVGILFVGAASAGAFAEPHERLLRTVANQASLSIHRLRGIQAQERQRLESLLEHLPEGVILIDPSQRIVFANPTARQYLSLLTDAEAGRVLTHIGAHPIAEILEPPPTGGGSHEVRLDQRVYEVQVRAIEAGPESGGWVLAIRDVTDDREIRERAQQQEHLAAIGQLAAGIAHDFNNTLTGIIGFASYLQNDPKVPDSARNWLRTIATQGQRAAQLVRQILDFSRQSILEKCHLDLFLLVEETIKFLERTIPENTAITLDGDPDEYIVHADPSQIQQVITNLAVNARDAMPEGGELRIRLARLVLEPDERRPLLNMLPGPWVILSVSDTGMGIPPEIMPRIYEPFFTTKRMGEGTGLGLAQVYGIITQHDGYIDAHSEPGQGTTFKIYLPAAQKKEIALTQPSEVIATGQGETILIVEDEPLVLDVVKTMLEQSGYQVLTATNGHEALAMYDRYRDQVSLVLSDMVMPEMYGPTLYEALRTRDPDIKMVMMTGYPPGKEARAFLTQRKVACVQKPIGFSQLTQIIGRSLGR